MSFAANFETLTLLGSNENNQLSSIGVQVLTIDDISIKIMQEPQLRKQLVDTFAKVIDSMIASDFDDKSVGRTFRILYDFKYMARPKVLAYTINETDFLECLLEQLPKLYF